MCNENLRSEKDDIKDILETIVVLQRRAEERVIDNEIAACDRDFLCCAPCEEIKCNTRPITLFCNCPANQWEISIDKENPNGPTSNVFRVEKVEDNTATFRVLILEHEQGCHTRFKATESFFTLRLGCICCLRCLPDTFIECL